MQYYSADNGKGRILQGNLYFNMRELLSITKRQELFQKIDLEDDGIVYLKEIVIYLRIMNEDIDDNLKVKHL